VLVCQHAVRQGQGRQKQVMNRSLAVALRVCQEQLLLAYVVGETVHQGRQEQVTKVSVCLLMLVLQWLVVWLRVCVLAYCA
jgi:hypothetical protein